MKEEPYAVQIQLLNSAVKTFLKCQTEEAYNILNQIFEFTSNEADNPDLRERGFMYWRLMSVDPNLASLIVLSEKPRISEDISNLDPSLLEKLVDNLGTLASVYGKPPELFVRKTKKTNTGEDDNEDYEENAFNLEETVHIENSKSRKETSNSNNYNGDKDGYNQTNQFNTTHEENNSEHKTNFNLLDFGESSTNNKTNENNHNVNVNSNSNIINSLQMDSIFGGGNSTTNLINSSNNLIDNFSSMSVTAKRSANVPKQVKYMYFIL